MAGLWRNNPNTPEGKYPIVLRRDGTPLESRYFVMTLKDPAAPAALRAYAERAEELGFEEGYVRDVRELARTAEAEFHRARLEGLPGDPDAPPHRKDDPAVLAWAKSIGCPGA